MAVDTREALRKLQSGQPLTVAEKKALNLPVTTQAPGPIASGAYLNPTAAPEPAPAGPAPTVDTVPQTGATVTPTPTPTVVKQTPTVDTSGLQAQISALQSAIAGQSLLAQQQAAAAAAAKVAEATANRQSAYDLLFSEFNKYGLGSLVEPLKGMITNAQVSPSEFSIALQNTDAYKQRFAANQDRIKQGLKALTPAEYIGLEDQYQNIMRNYGLPSSYWAKDSLGTQAGFNKFIANDVSATELEDRIATAVQRVNGADANVKDALRRFYPSITDGDILAYTLDPTNALNDIKRKVTAAEIGGAALAQGLATDVTRAEDLAKYGITKAQAQQGYTSIGEFLPTATALADIYNKQGLGQYDQATAEAEIFNTADAAAAARKRKRLSELERASFGGSSGTSSGALSRDRAGAYQGYREPGAGSF